VDPSITTRREKVLRTIMTITIIRGNNSICNSHLPCLYLSNLNLQALSYPTYFLQDRMLVPVSLVIPWAPKDISSIRMPSSSLQVKVIALNLSQEPKLPTNSNSLFSIHNPSPKFKEMILINSNNSSITTPCQECTLSLKIMVALVLETMEELCHLQVILYSTRILLKLRMSTSPILHG
jgi:hypothetical protein